MTIVNTSKLNRIPCCSYKSHQKEKKNTEEQQVLIFEKLEEDIVGFFCQFAAKCAEIAKIQYACVILSINPVKSVRLYVHECHLGQWPGS